MRTPWFFALLFVLVFVFVGCDSGGGNGEDDALVGSWRLEAITETVRVTSTTTQTLPDFSAAPTVSVQVSGARAFALDEVVTLFGSGSTMDLTVATDQDWISARGAVLTLTQSPGGAQATLTDAASGDQFSGFFGDGAVLTRQNGRFTVPPRTLDGAGSITIGGTVVYPDLILAPGQPIEVKPYDLPLDGTLTLTFGADGAFSARAVGSGSSASATGTWQRQSDDRVRLTSSDTDVIESGVFEVRQTNGALELKGENVGLDGPCTTACIRRVEPEVFAAPGSISAMAFVFTFRFRAA